MKSFYENASDTEILPTSGSILSALAKDSTLFPKIMSLLPTEEQLKDAHQQLQNSLNQTLAGDLEKDPLHKANRQLLNRRLSRFTALVKLAAEEDPSLLVKIGIVERVREKSKPGTLHILAPGNFRVRHGEEHGMMIGKADAVKGARSFEVEICEGDPTNEKNWRFGAVSVHSSRMEIRGLVPGTVYSFRVRAIAYNGAGPWSSYVTLMAI